jgi:hypothetical protein
VSQHRQHVRHSRHPRLTLKVTTDAHDRHHDMRGVFATTLRWAFRAERKSARRIKAKDELEKWGVTARDLQSVRYNGSAPSAMRLRSGGAFDAIACMSKRIGRWRGKVDNTGHAYLAGATPRTRLLDVTRARHVPREASVQATS